VTFAETIRAAVDDFATNGYDSEQRLEAWIARIRDAARADLVPEFQVEEELRANLTNIYERLIERGEIMRRHPGADRFTLSRIRPQLHAETRRVAIDQGHKFMATLSQIIANDGGAIAGIWHQHYTRHPRHAHRQRDGKVYLIRGSWAHKAGFVKPGPAGYADEITQPGEEVYCRCTFEYLYGFRKLPPDMLTDDGREKLAVIRAAAAA
jgi:hypothetical protein